MVPQNAMSQLRKASSASAARRAGGNSSRMRACKVRDQERTHVSSM